ncbi:hypothetical protein OQA88_9325 [Cercophora sp. LCS_1]
MSTQPRPVPVPSRYSYLFGKKLTNSMSPELHAVVYSELGLPWAQQRLDSDDIPAFLNLLKDPNCYGSSVTMPNKVLILPHLQHLTPECLAVGACNTIFFTPSPSDPSRRILSGTNTDVIGVRDSFLRTTSPTLWEGKPALVLGSGGAARSAVYALRTWMNVGPIYLVNRFADEVESVISWCKEHGYGEDLIHVETVEQARSLDGPGAVVACIPDFPPVSAEEKQARAVFEMMLGKGPGAMLEMCYNPTPWTELAGVAEGLGWRVIPGTEALIWQGLEQDRYWTGRETEALPVGKVQRWVGERVGRGRDGRL